MLDLDKYDLNQYGEILHKEKSLFESLYNGIDISVFHQNENDPGVVRFNDTCLYFEKIGLLKYTPVNLPIEEFDEILQSEFYIPNEYIIIDILNLLIKKCITNEEIIRVKLEYKLYEKHNMVMILRFCIYIVDVMRQNNIVWGVGRGSSAASYILFLIGIHKINSLKYNLDIGEFFKEL